MDRPTVDRLVVEHLPAALRCAQRLSGDPNLAEDVVQEALCLVLRRWRSYRGEGSFRSWLLKIVVNVHRDRRRRSRNELPIPEEELRSRTATPIDQAVANEQQAKLRAAIDQLPERQREVALLSLGEGLTAGDTAQVLDITEANVHTCLHLARKRIASAIGFDFARREMT